MLSPITLPRINEVSSHRGHSRLRPWVPSRTKTTHGHTGGCKLTLTRCNLRRLARDEHRWVPGRRLPEVGCPVLRERKTSQTLAEEWFMAEDEYPGRFIGLFWTWNYPGEFFLRLILPQSNMTNDLLLSFLTRILLPRILWHSGWSETSWFIWLFLTSS